MIIISLTAVSICLGFLAGCQYVFKKSYHIGVVDYFYLLIWNIMFFLLCSVGSMKYNAAGSLYMKVKTIMMKSRGVVAYHGALLATSITDKPLHISAGLFNVNISFLLNVGGIVVTYWVILIQFEMSYDSTNTLNKLLTNFNITIN